jgi:hypothetical protein
VTDLFARLFGVGKLSPQRFAQLYIALGKRQGVLGQPIADPHDFVVRDGDVSHGLASVYDKFLALPRRAREGYLIGVLQSYQTLAPDGAAPSWDEAAPRLLPRLRDAAFLDRVTLGSASRGRRTAPSSAWVAPGLFLTLVLDGEQTMATVSSELLDGWGQSFEAAAERARKNLSEVSADAFVELVDGLWIAPWEDAYAASRLILPHILQRIARDPLVAVPNRDTLLVASARGAATLEGLVTAIEGASEQHGYPLTRRIFQLHDRSLEPYELPGDQPSSIRHHNACVKEVVASYGEQQRPLQRSVGDDIYVASIEADEALDGRLVTRTLWSDRDASLLPRADRVHLLQSEEESGQPTSSRIWVSSWEQLTSIEGAIAATDHHLPRFRTGRFPGADELRRFATPVELDRHIAELDSGGGLR